MVKQFTNIAFTPEVKKAQIRYSEADVAQIKAPLKAPIQQLEKQLARLNPSN